MKAFTLIASTVAAVSMGAIGFTYAQSSTNPPADPTLTSPSTSAVTPGSTTTTTTTGTTGTTGAMSTDTMTNERMARADRN